MSLPSPRSRRLRALAACVLASFVLTVSPGLVRVPAALAATRDDLKTAKDHFDFGEYDRALAVLNPPIEAGQLQGTLLRDYLELRARCAVGLGQAGRARDDYCRLHLLDPQWRPDPVNYTSDETTAFETAVADCQAAAPAPAPTPAVKEKKGTPFFAKPVTWLVAGVGVAAVLLLGGGGSDETPADGPLGDYPPPPAK